MVYLAMPRRAATRRRPQLRRTTATRVPVPLESTAGLDRVVTLKLKNKIKTQLKTILLCKLRLIKSNQ